MSDTLAKNDGWKLGDRIFIQGDMYPVNLELNVRGIFHSDPPGMTRFSWSVCRIFAYTR